ncbi:unnamed protein product [Gongylonema pulchrum]|uniref:Uncharacterized protein n=1 Tax=Gongylonema pulchrum TaxID=637853 RepID=A0A3P6RT78_9BILA|nr:unnamed protein product [Gongylonema pulchrum]
MNSMPLRVFLQSSSSNSSSRSQRSRKREHERNRARDLSSCASCPNLSNFVKWSSPIRRFFLRSSSRSPSPIRRSWKPSRITRCNDRKMPERGLLLCRNGVAAELWKAFAQTNK